MESKRQDKISKLLQQDLSQIFQLDARRLYKGAMITVTKITISPDLSVAKVYVSLFATKDVNEILQLIKENTKDVRRQLGNRVRNQLRVVPNLQFYIDDSLDYIENIESLLKED
jgi:ribosome-binding factor A